MALMIAVAALRGKCIQCISKIIAPRMPRLHAHSVLIDIDCLSILTIFDEELQGDREPSAVFFKNKLLDLLTPMPQNFPKLVG